MIHSYRMIGCLSVFAMLGIFAPSAEAGPRGSGGHANGAGRSIVYRSTRVERASDHRERMGGGSISYNAYWRAATSPNPPSTRLNANRYWQEMQAWQTYHVR